MANYLVNIWAKLYMTWVVPTMLTSFLVHQDPSLASKNVHQIELLRLTAAKKQAVSTLTLERSLTFSPVRLTELLEPILGGTMWKFNVLGQDDLFETSHRVECDIPTYLLERVLPPDSLSSPEATIKSRFSKRTRDANLGEHAEQPASKAKRSRMTQRSVNAEGDSGLNHPMPRARKSLGTHHTNTGLPASKVDRRFQDLAQSTPKPSTYTTPSEWPEIIDLT
jgi:Holliday junction resolvase YEN1